MEAAFPLQSPGGEEAVRTRVSLMTPSPASSLRPPSGEKMKEASPSNNYAGLSQSRVQMFNASYSPTPSETTTAASDTSSVNSDSSRTNVKCLFKKAYEYLNPGKTFRAAAYLFAERKLMVFFLVHFAATMIIWQHFALNKFEQQKAKVPAGAAFYWWKILAPTLEFGSMHAILFQMALLPLTMARYSISVMAGTTLDRFIPLNRTLRMHIHLGYTMVVILVLATAFFLAFFGVLCNGGEELFCRKFTSEIMCTGYGILAALLIVAGTSHFRHRIPYELFYVIHHLVFVMYIITVAHTFDIEQRRNRADRSQTFKWFSATILYYVCDRVAMHLNHKYRTRLVSSSLVSGSNDARMVILTLRRPALFRFKPGQYAYLRVGKIDNHWHPFSIASDPSSPNLQFYVEVYSNKSWTGKIWDMLQDDRDSKFSSRQIDVEIMGPIGTPLAETEDYSHALAIGTGTGIVPILSLFKQQVHQLLRLDPEIHFREIKSHRTKVHEVEIAEQSRKGSFVERLLRSCRLQKKSYLKLQESRGDTVKESIRNSIARRDVADTLTRQEFQATMAQMKTAAFQATRSIYGTVLLCILPVIGLTLIGLMISWNTITIEVRGGMTYFLKAFTVGFQACFAVIAFFIWDSSEFLTYIDMAMTLIAPFADWYWLLLCENNGTLNPGDLTLYCLLTGYMVFRLWSMAVIPRHRSWRTRVENEGIRTMERFDMVWVARSASLVSEILPDINEIWKSLVDTWGEKNAASVCRISIYVTDKDPDARSLLEKEICNTLLYKSGSVHFERPDFSAMIQDHTIELIATRRHSHSLLAYVGSPQLAQEIHHCKISNDMVTAITGHKKHQMEFVSESYGGVKPKAKNAFLVDSVAGEEPTMPTKDLKSHLADIDCLSVRNTTSYGDDGCDASNRFSDSGSKV